MNSISKDITDFVDASPDSSLSFKTDLFYGREPTKPDNCITIFDASDRGPFLEPNKQDKNDIYHYGAFQARARNKSYDEAGSALYDLVGVLHGIKFAINGTRYTLVQALDEPTHLDWDENNRARWIVNFTIQRTPQT